MPYHSIVFICMHLCLISSILKLIFPTLVHLCLLSLHPCTPLSLSFTILYEGGGSLEIIHIVTLALAMSWAMMCVVSSRFQHKLMFNIGNEYISIHVITYSFPPTSNGSQLMKILVLSIDRIVGLPHVVVCTFPLVKTI